MHSILLDSPTDAHHSPPIPTLPPLPSSYESILDDSIGRFLAGIRGDSCDFSSFQSVFSRLIQSRADPPLEIVWFYAAAVYRDAARSKTAVRERVTAVRDLLQLLIACLPVSSPAKGVGLVAPVVSELYYAAIEVDAMGGGKDARKARREVERLVEGVMGYVSICSGKGFEEAFGCGNLLRCFPDVVRVWMMGRGGGVSEMERFFPLVSDEMRSRFSAGVCGVGDLAAVVAVQVFLLMAWIKLEGGGGTTKVDVQNELRGWAVGVLTGFQNIKFFEMLMKLLLNSKLPTLPSLSANHEIILRQILYDSILLADYSFMSPLTEVEKLDSLRHLGVLRLIVFHEAIQVARKKGDHNKAIAYTNAFSRSLISQKLIQWVNNQSDRIKPPSSTSTTPQVLIKWLLGLEKQGFRVLEEDILTHCDKLEFDDRNSKVADHVLKANVPIDEQQLFFIDTKGDSANDELPQADAMELAGDAFASAARAMNSKNSSGKKRKGSQRKTQAKYVKYKLHDANINDYFASPATVDSSIESEVEDPLSDDDVKEMEE